MRKKELQQGTQQDIKCTTSKAQKRGVLKYQSPSTSRIEEERCNTFNEIPVASLDWKGIKIRQREGIEEKASIGEKSLEVWLHLPRTWVHIADVNLGTLKKGTLGGVLCTPKVWDKAWAVEPHAFFLQNLGSGSTTIHKAHDLLDHLEQDQAQLTWEWNYKMEGSCCTYWISQETKCLIVLE